MLRLQGVSQGSAVELVQNTTRPAASLVSRYRRPRRRLATLDVGARLPTSFAYSSIG